MKLLKQLYEIYSPSGKEKPMMDFIESYCKKEGAVVVRDNHAIYVTKGKSDTYPCVIAHTDQVQTGACKAYQAGNIVFGLAPNGRSFEGLGADDKNGIWIALKCFDAFAAIKLAFFVEEERGCLGSSKANLDFFKDCRFVIQCDRKGGHDFIQSISGTKLCSEEFINDVPLAKYGFKREFGMMTDVQTLRKKGVKVSCCNISCGYYEPHTNREYTLLPELKNTLSFVKDIIKTCTKTYEDEAPKPLYIYDDDEQRGWFGGGYGGGYSSGGFISRSTTERLDDLEFCVQSHEDSIDELLRRIAALEKKVGKGKPKGEQAKGKAKGGDIPEA